MFYHLNKVITLKIFSIFSSTVITKFFRVNSSLEDKGCSIQSVQDDKMIKEVH